MGKTMAYKLIYPEIYYKLQPYIMVVCDQMDIYNVPTQEMVESMTDAIYDDVFACSLILPNTSGNMRQRGTRNNTTRRYYCSSGSCKIQRQNKVPRFRRRGLFKDLIDILLLTELLRRRRR